MKIYVIRKYVLFVVFVVAIAGAVILALSVSLALMNKPYNVKVSNVTGSSFSVSWVTDRPMVGSVYYQKDNKFLPGILGILNSERAYDDRDWDVALDKNIKDLNAGLMKDASAEVDLSSIEYENVKTVKKGRTYTHHVTVNGLAESAKYNYKIQSGFWLFDIPASEVLTLSIPANASVPKPLFGSLEPESSAVSVIDSVVYFEFNDVTESAKSRLYSVPVNTDGNWYIDANNVRNAEGNFMELESGQDTFDVNVQFENNKERNQITWVLGYFESSYPNLLVKGDKVSSSKINNIVYAAYDDAIQKALDGGMSLTDAAKIYGYGNVAKFEAKNNNDGKLDGEVLAKLGLGDNAGNLNAIAGTTVLENNYQEAKQNNNVYVNVQTGKYEIEEKKTGTENSASKVPNGEQESSYPPYQAPVSTLGADGMTTTDGVGTVIVPQGDQGGASSEDIDDSSRKWIGETILENMRNKIDLDLRVTYDENGLYFYSEDNNTVPLSYNSETGEYVIGDVSGFASFAFSQMAKYGSAIEAKIAQGLTGVSEDLATIDTTADINPTVIPLMATEETGADKEKLVFIPSWAAKSTIAKGKNLASDVLGFFGKLAEVSSEITYESFISSLCIHEGDQNDCPDQGVSMEAIEIKSDGSDSPVAFFDMEKLVSKTYAQESDISSDLLYYSPDKGVFNVEVNGVSVADDVFMNGNDVILFYENTNGIEGFQYYPDDEEKSDKIIDQSSITISTSKIVEEQSLELKKGINLISFNYLPVKHDGSPMLASEIFSHSSDLVRYISVFENGGWGDTYGGDKGGVDFSLVPGRGYLILSEGDSRISLYGKDLLENAPISFGLGWNLIGLNGYTEVSTARAFLDTVNASKYLSADNVTKWDLETGMYEGLQVEGESEYGFDFGMEFDKGYFVRVVDWSDNQDCKTVLWMPSSDKNGLCSK